MVPRLAGVPEPRGLQNQPGQQVLPAAELARRTTGQPARRTQGARTDAPALGAQQGPPARARAERAPPARILLCAAQRVRFAPRGREESRTVRGSESARLGAHTHDDDSKRLPELRPP